MSGSTGSGAATPFLALACVGMFVASPVQADEAADDADSPDRSILVEGERERLEADSTKATAPILDTPQTVTVISRETIEQQNLLTLRDVLSTVPGITFGAGEGGGGYGDSINLRGYSASNDLTVDGVRDSAQYSRTDPFNVEAIEVYNGANSVYSGSGAIGGTINIVQKRPAGRDFTQLEAGIGTDEYYRAAVDTNQRLTDSVAVRLNAMAHTNDVPGLDVVGFERWGIAPSVTLGMASPVSATFSYVHQEDDNVPVYGVPYFPALGGLVPGGDYAGYYGYRDVDTQESKLDQATARVEAQLADSLLLTNQTRWQRVGSTTIVNPPQGTYCLADGTTQAGVPCAGGQVPGMYYPSGPRGTTRIAENRLIYNQTDLRAEFATGGVGHVFVVGVSGAQEDYELAQGNVQRNPDGTVPPLPPIVIADPDTLYDGPVNFIPSSEQAGEVSNLAAYAFDTMTFTPWLELNLGARIESNKGEFQADTIATPAAGGGVTASLVSDSDETLFSYRAGVVVKPSPTSSLYLAYANSKTPSLATVRLGCVSNNAGDFCDAAPEGAENWELGGKVMLGKMLLTAAAFRNERTNYRVPSNDPSVPDPQVLDGRARVDGIALGASGTLGPWGLFANYTYLDSEVLQSVSDFCLANPGAGTCPVSDVQAGRPLESTPEHSGSLFTTYTFPFGLQLGYGLTYQGSYAVVNDAATLLTAPDYLLHRAFASYDFGNGLTAQVNVQNLTDEKYFTGIRNNANGWAVPGEGRSARLTLFYRF